MMDLDHLRVLLSGERQEPIVIGAIFRPELVELIGAPGRHAVLLSYETVVKQRREHPKIGLDDYWIAPDILRFGMVTQEWPGHLTFWYNHHTGNRYRMFVKSTIRGDELYMTSLHRTRPKQAKAQLERGTLLARHA